MISSNMTVNDWCVEWSPSNIFQICTKHYKATCDHQCYSSLFSGWLLIIVYPDGVVVELWKCCEILSNWRDLMHMLSEVDVNSKQLQSMFGSSSSSLNSGIPWYSHFCQRYYCSRLERKQPPVAVRRFSCILPPSDIYTWQPGWQLQFARWSQTVLDAQIHTLYRFI